MLNQFDIGIWDKTDNHTEPIELYLEKYSLGEYDNWKSTLGSSQLLIQLNGKSYEPYTGCFVEMTGRQFLFAYDRLKAGQDAFLKYNMVFSPEDFYLLFEPKGDEIWVSELRTQNHRFSHKKNAALINTDLLRPDPNVSSDLNHEKGEFFNRFPFIYWHPDKSEEERSLLDVNFLDYVLSNKEAIKVPVIDIEIYNLAFPKVFLLECLLKNGRLAMAANRLTEMPLVFDYY